MRSVLCTRILAVEATLGGVGFADVEDLEAVADEEVSKPRRRPGSGFWQVVSRSIPKRDKGPLPGRLALALHPFLEIGHHT